MTEDIKMIKLTKKQILIAGIIAVIGIFHISKPALYSKLWGKPISSSSAELIETFEDLGNQPWQKTYINGYNIEYCLRTKYHVKGRIIWVDWNDGLINTWYHSAGKEVTKLYNAVASVDISIAHGATSDPDNLRKIKFKHSERALVYTYLYKDNPIINHDEINNNHVIPATTAIRRAIALLKKGDVAEFEGYLMDWKGTGKFSYFNIETATKRGDVHTKQLYGGIPGAGMCRQFYVTKIIYNGYLFE